MEKTRRHGFWTIFVAMFLMSIVGQLVVVPLYQAAPPIVKDSLVVIAAAALTLALLYGLRAAIRT